MLKILHVADLHLDTVFSLEDVQTAELRQDDLYQSADALL